VIAADLTALQWLVAALEPISLEGYEGPLTGGNVLEFLQAAWEAPPGAGTIAERHDSDWWSHRKDFMGIVLDGLMGRLEGGEDLDLGKLAWTLKRCLDEKHLLLNVDDPDVATLLADAGWDGALHPGEDDFLMVVDSNMGFNKVNPRIQQEIDYQVTLAEGDRPSAELRVHYRHTGAKRLEECILPTDYGDSYEEMMDRCYWDYVRVYVPKGSELRAASGFEPDSVENLPGERKTQVFAGYFVLAPGDEHEVVIKYDLPPETTSGQSYRLRVQKQPGASGLPLRVQVTGPVSATFETTLSSDQQFTVPQPPEG